MVRFSVQRNDPDQKSWHWSHHHHCIVFVNWAHVDSCMNSWWVMRNYVWINPICLLKVYLFLFLAFLWIVLHFCILFLLLFCLQFLKSFFTIFNVAFLSYWFLVFSSARFSNCDAKAGEVKIYVFFNTRRPQM